MAADGPFPRGDLAEDGGFSALESYSFFCQGGFNQVGPCATSRTKSRRVCA